MAKFSETSNNRLETAHQDLQVLFNEVVKHFDCTIVHGHRTPEEQFELFKIGREKINGEWVKVSEDVVTHKDGYNKTSKHNENPSHAIDAVPWFPEAPHIRWEDIETLYYFAGYVLGISNMLFEQGKISHRIKTGADWSMDNDVNDESFRDIVHFEIID